MKEHIKIKKDHPYFYITAYSLWYTMAQPGTPYKIGMIGLAPMGKSLALNLQSKGFFVVGYNRSSEPREEAKKAGLKVVDSLKSLANSLGEKRIFWIMVKDNAVDIILEQLAPLLKKNDVIIEGGNTYFKETDKRTQWAENKGVLYIGTGVSGGEEGALKGPSLMPGGHKKAYEIVEPILSQIAAKYKKEPCVAYIGKGGAGHFVKMVHNGIEYAMMQALGEIYHVFSSCFDFETTKKFFEKISKNELQGFLTEATFEVLNTIDKSTKKPLIYSIKDSAKNKGTGKWTSQTAYDLGVPVPSISAALLARIISSYKNGRMKNEKVFSVEKKKFEGNKQHILEYAEQSLYVTFVVAYSQGFQLMQAGSKEYGYDLDMVSIAKVWRGGCIIRSQLLIPIVSAFEKNKKIENIMTDEKIAKELKQKMKGLRETTKISIDLSVPCPVLSQSLAYFDSYRAGNLPSASLIQGLRDYFGSHTYERFDKKGNYHTLWSKKGKPEEKKE